jgi:hypothetical protein
MNLWDEITADGDEFLSTFGREVTFRNKKVVVLVNTNPVDQMFSEGGFVYRATFKIRFLCKPNSELSNTPPAQGEQVEVYGRPYTVTSVTNRPPSPWIDCQVQSSTQ